MQNKTTNLCFWTYGCSNQITISIVLIGILVFGSGFGYLFILVKFLKGVTMKNRLIPKVYNIKYYDQRKGVQVLTEVGSYEEFDILVRHDNVSSYFYSIDAVINGVELTRNSI